MHCVDQRDGAHRFFASFATFFAPGVTCGHLSNFKHDDLMSPALAALYREYHRRLARFLGRFTRRGEFMTPLTFAPEFFRLRLSVRIARPDGMHYASHRVVQMAGRPVGQRPNPPEL
ncbi:hypothetical protein J2797_006710 [Paraburkholderia terricola]|uniref:hypothetical protein n=1 Tax=Paraburkholderia terricola TaxID=169427 RepID=UPI002854988D|nr:hypothetical protein [Paraburkholderia terricola]MDR6450007.1 hypothetical protein [Paraburkholderia terricola]MDR6496783.1 hypothetical protein [Paraburkholderia terricola]